MRAICFVFFSSQISCPRLNQWISVGWLTCWMFQLDFSSTQYPYLKRLSADESAIICPLLRRSEIECLKKYRVINESQKSLMVEWSFSTLPCHLYCSPKIIWLFCLVGGFSSLHCSEQLYSSLGDSREKVLFTSNGMNALAMIFDFLLLSVCPLRPHKLVHWMSDCLFGNCPLTVEPKRMDRSGAKHICTWY